MKNDEDSEKDNEDEYDGHEYEKKWWRKWCWRWRSNVLTPHCRAPPGLFLDLRKGQHDPGEALPQIVNGTELVTRLVSCDPSESLASKAFLRGQGLSSQSAVSLMAWYGMPTAYISCIQLYIILCNVKFILINHPLLNNPLPQFPAIKNWVSPPY